jgi:hypothetical protein
LPAQPPRVGELEPVHHGLDRRTDFGGVGVT